MHLNPLRIRGLGLDKRGRVEESRGFRLPSKEMLAERLKMLRAYPWSSYRAYAGYSTVPPWLTVEALLERAHENEAQCHAQYRSEAKQRLTYGEDPDRAERLRDAVAIGGAAFIKTIRDGAASLSLDGVAGKRELRRRIEISEIRQAVIAVTGVAPEHGKRGDLSRPLFAWAARRYSGLTLSEIGEHCGNMNFSAVSVTAKRFEVAMAKDRNVKSAGRKLCSMLKVEP